MRNFANTHKKRFSQNHSCLFLQQWMIMINWATDRWETVFILFFYLFQPWPVQKGDESKWVCLQKAGAEEWACLPTMARLLFSQFSVDRAKPGSWPGQICETHGSPEHIHCCHANERLGPAGVHIRPVTCLGAILAQHEEGLDVLVFLNDTSSLIIPSADGGASVAKALLPQNEWNKPILLIETVCGISDPNMIHTLTRLVVLW